MTEDREPVRLKTRVVAIIPARMGSSRFPGKPLVPILGLPMIEHVRRRVLLAPWLDGVFVATCDREIADAVENAGGNAIMTSDTHLDCTDRVEEAVRKIDADVVLIVQGDEPLVRLENLEPTICPLLGDASVKCASLLSVIEDPSDLANSDVVKAVLDGNGDLMYLSRAPIPFSRDSSWAGALRQTGISAFRKDTLSVYTSLKPTPLELTERVGFLRMLESGQKIRGVVVNDRTCGVDRPEDVPAVEDILRNDPVESSYFQRISAR